MMQIQARGSLNLRFKIHTNLVTKYSNKFFFFFSKPISQTIFNDNKSSANLLIKDICMYCDDAECLNRMYHYFNAFGKEQIYDRIRLIGGFYQDSVMLPEYPLMIVTNTAKLFKARQRRLRKMISSDCSSDQSEEPQENQQSFDSSGFLRSISKPQSQLSISSSKNIEEQFQNSYDSEVYTIYADSPSIYQISSLKMKKNEFQQSLSHLVCDFNDIDIQKTLADFQRIKQVKKISEKSKQKPSLTLNSLTASKPVYKSIIFGEKNGLTPKIPHDKIQVISNEQENLCRNREKKSRGKYYEKQSQSREKIPTSRQKILQQYKKRERQKILPQNEHQYRNTYIRKTTQRTQEQKARKQMVREKALRLLNRVSSQHYMKGKYDFASF